MTYLLCIILKKGIWGEAPNPLFLIVVLLSSTSKVEECIFQALCKSVVGVSPFCNVLVDSSNEVGLCLVGVCMLWDVSFLFPYARCLFVYANCLFPY